MKKYITPSLEAFEIEVEDPITASGFLNIIPRFIEGTEDATSTVGEEQWNNDWE